MKTHCLGGRLLAAAGWLLLLGTPGRADEKLAGIACRSVHLFYPAPEGVAFYNEVTVDQSAPGTYFMACGFDLGYFGIQELANGKKLVLFSVWDPGTQADLKQADPNQVEADRRVKLLYQGEGVRVGRFGNEGTGGQSFFDFDWKVGKTYRFFVTARPAGDRTEFAGYFYVPEKRAWQHLVTFSTISQGRGLRGYYSFIEDFRRDRVSLATEAASGTIRQRLDPLERPAVGSADAGPVYCRRQSVAQHQRRSGRRLLLSGDRRSDEEQRRSTGQTDPPPTIGDRVA